MGDDTEDTRAQQETQARERITRSVNEFVDDHPETRRVGKVAEDGEYGHPFHNKVAAYIKENNAKLQQEFMVGFHSREQERAMAYLIQQGIIDSRTPTSRINEFLAGWNIPPLPDQESDDVTIDVGEATVVTGPAVTKTGKVLTDADFEALADEAERGYDVSHLKPRVTPSQDDEIVDAEVIEDE